MPRRGYMPVVAIIGKLICSFGAKHQGFIVPYPAFCSCGAMKKYSIRKFADGLCFDYIYTKNNIEFYHCWYYKKKKHAAVASCVQVCVKQKTISTTADEYISYLLLTHFQQ